MTRSQPSRSPPADDAAEITNGKLQNGAVINTGAKAREFAKVMEFHTLEATEGKRYAEMGRFLTPTGADTSDEALAAKTPDGRPVENGLRNMWVTETALTTALNMSFMAEQLSLFGIVMGIALLHTGIGFLVLAIGGALRKLRQHPSGCAAAEGCGHRLSGDSTRDRKAAPAALRRSPDNGAVEKRFRTLVEAGIAISSELSLDAVLQRIAEAAAELTDARYAALGVIDPAGTGLERFLSPASTRTPSADRRAATWARHPRRADPRRRAASPCTTSATIPSSVGLPAEPSSDDELSSASRSCSAASPTGTCT